MINYILQVILFQVLFLAIYDFFLSKETFFTKNRWYLLSTPIVSFLIPLIKIPTFQKAVPKEFIVYLPEIVLSPEKVIQQKITETGFYESVNYINILFWIGVALFSVLFLIKLVKIINIIRKYKVVKEANFTLILLPKETKAFSFFNYIFLGKEIDESKREKIIQHELVHSQQKHSLDLLFFEILKIAMWFNPIIYFYQKRITLVHEYISDAVVAKSETKESYINNLLSSFFQVENIAFVNQFYKKSLIKKRIIMMTKKQSKKINQLKYLLLIPALVSMLFYSSCSENFSENEITPRKQLQTKYRNSNGKLVSFEGYEMTYLDDYLGDVPPKEVVEISFEDLASYEKEEFNDYLKRTKEHFKDKPTILKSLKYKFFKMPNGRNAYGTIEKGLNFIGKNSNQTETKELTIYTVDEAPTFPECEDGDIDCFSEKLQEHFQNNLNHKNLSK
ncbi:MAG: M56 family metallopeptidase [Polaribacter sp.]|uniref:M56 family metallopeptidase n=1 Tax=Polaribacter sp. TaxID=1920175 RepID=UPI003BB20124